MVSRVISWKAISNTRFCLLKRLTPREFGQHLNIYGGIFETQGRSHEESPLKYYGEIGDKYEEYLGTRRRVGMCGYRFCHN